MDDGTNTEHLVYSPISYYNGTHWVYNSAYDLHGVNGFVMGGYGAASWYLHPDTESRTSTRITHYDGYP